MARSNIITKLAFPVQTPGNAASRAVPGADAAQQATQDVMTTRDDRVEQTLEHLNFQRRPQLSSEFLAGDLASVGTGANKKNREVIAIDSTKTNLIQHKLGREYQGWQIVWRDADVTIYEDIDDNSDRTTTLPLKSSANVNIRLVVF